MKEAITGKQASSKPDINEYVQCAEHFVYIVPFCTMYFQGKFIERDMASDPPLDSNGNYRPQKPKGWDESYHDGPPSWAGFAYNQLSSFYIVYTSFQIHTES